MVIQQLILGEYETNCYCLRSNENTANCLIIDTGFGAYELLDLLEEQRLNPVAVVLTHGHVDHIAGLDELREKFPDVRVYIHKLDANMLTDPISNLSAMSGEPFSTTPADALLEDEDTIDLAGIKLQVIPTPGHTPGGISLYNSENRVVFTGDALFADSVGRTDFPGGDMAQLLQGIKENLLTLPEETKVCPGHGPISSIAREKQSNQYLK